MGRFRIIGNLAVQTDALKRGTTMHYDVLNRVISKINIDGTITYAYDDTTNGYAKGRLTSVSDLSGSTAFYYDKMGRNYKKVRTIDGVPYATENTYDDLGRETSLKYPDNTYTYNLYESAVLKQVSANSNHANPYATLAYDNTAVGKLQGTTYGNGVITNYTYYANSQRLNTLITTTPLGATPSNTQVQNLTYGYDGIGNITTITGSINGQNADQTFAYDNLDRLLSATGFSGTRSYNYDILGNINNTTNPDNTYNTKNTYLANEYDFESLAGLDIIGSGAELKNGRYGTSAGFNGNGYLEVPANNALTPGTQLTIAYWLKPDGLNNSYAIDKSDSYGLGKNATAGTIEGYIKIGSETKTISANGIKQLCWNQVTMVYNGTSLKLYVNGVLKSSVTTSGKIAQVSAPLKLGQGLVGRVDELKVKARAIGGDEIATYYQQTYTQYNLVPNQPLSPKRIDRNNLEIANDTAIVQISTVHSSLKCKI